MKVSIGKDVRGEWRWKLVSPNGRSIAVSGEGYKKRKHALEMVGLILDLESENVTIEFNDSRFVVPGEATPPPVIDDPVET